MNKTELLNWLESQTWCDHIGTPEFVANDGYGSLWYKVTIREVYESTAINRMIHYYVVNENTPNETAYWKESTPTATLGNTNQNTTPTYKWVSYRTILAELEYSVAASIIAKIKAAAVTDPVIEQVHAMLSSYGGSEPGVDINSSAVQALITSMAGTLLTQAEADAVLSLADPTNET